MVHSSASFVRHTPDNQPDLLPENQPRLAFRPGYETVLVLDCPRTARLHPHGNTMALLVALVRQCLTLPLFKCLENPDSTE
jgi:hypothetical protein